MEYVDGFEIVGISIQTTNQAGQSAPDIGRLWQQFYEKNIPAQVTDRVGEEVYAVYTDYTSDYRGTYTAMIGVRVSSPDSVPNGLTGRRLNGDHYTKFVARGEMPQAVFQTWQEIWDRDDELGRSYTADFEVYGAKYQNEQVAEVDVYVAVQSGGD